MSGPGEHEVHTDSEHDLWRTLVLLAIDTAEGVPVYFIVEGLAGTGDIKEMEEHERYFYEEHTCPTNFVGPHGKDSEGYGVVALYHGGDRDPHGVFRYVRAVWMPRRYVNAKSLAEQRGHNVGPNPEDIIEELFPELLGKSVGAI